MSFFEFADNRTHNLPRTEDSEDRRDITAEVHAYVASSIFEYMAPVGLAKVTTGPRMLRKDEAGDLVFILQRTTFAQAVILGRLSTFVESQYSKHDTRTHALNLPDSVIVINSDLALYQIRQGCQYRYVRGR